MNESTRVYASRGGAVVVDRNKHTVGLRMILPIGVKLSIEEARDLILQLAAAIGDVEMRDALDQNNRSNSRATVEELLAALRGDDQQARRSLADRLEHNGIAFTPAAVEVAR